ncbi:MAG: two-component regulator propeller domain-containing protein, partial [Planctomycetota bacterium]
MTSGWQILCLSLCCCLTSLGQIRGQTETQIEAEGRNDLRPRFVESNWKTSDGLPQETVTAITKSKSGYMWIGTFGGLCRFDGVRFENFTIAQYPEMKTNRVLSLFEASDGTLWIGTNGLGVVRFANGEFSQPENLAGLGDVWDICETVDGAMWFVGNGCTRLLGAEVKRFRFPGNSGCHAFLDCDLSAQGQLWIAGRHGTFEFRDDSFHLLSLTAIDDQPVSLAFGPQGKLWLVGYRSIYWMIDGVVARVCDHGCGGPFRIIADDAGGAWLGAANGVLRVEPEVVGTPVLGVKLSRPLRSPGIAGGIRSLALGLEGELWLGTTRNGLCRAVPAPFSKLRFPATSRSVDSHVMGDGNDGLWILREPGGLYHWSPRDLTTIYESGTPASAGLALIGSQAGGPSYFRNKDRVLISEGLKLRELSEPRTLHGGIENLNGVSWFGGEGGLYSLKDGSFEFHPVLGVAATVLELKLVDTDGTLWFSGAGFFGCRFAGDQGMYRFFTAADGLPPGRVRGVHQDKDGGIWISSYGGGLARYQEGRFDKIGLKQGLIDQNLGGMLEDDQFRLWVNSNRGILVMALKELHAVADGILARVSCRLLDSGEVNGATAYRDAKGRFWFPTTHDLVVIDPSEYQPSSARPPSLVESIVADGAELDLSNSIVIEPGEGNLEIRYTAFSYAQAERIRFRYRLSNYDDHWTEVGTVRRAVFTKVPPGEYSFEVQAAAENGEWNPDGARLSVTIKPAFHQTAWFLVLATLGSIGALWLLYRWRFHKIRGMARELKAEITERKQSEDERRKIQQELIESSKLEAVGRLAGGIAHDFNNILTAIIGNAELLRSQIKSEKRIDNHRDYIEQTSEITA